MKNLIRMKNIVDRFGFDEPAWKHIWAKKVFSVDKVRKNPGQGNPLELTYEEGIDAYFSLFFFKHFRAIDTTRWAKEAALSLLPLIFIELKPKTYGFPWLSFTDRFHETKDYHIGAEYTLLPGLEPSREPVFGEDRVLLFIGNKYVYFKPRDLSVRSNTYTFFDIGRLFFGFLQTMGLELSDFDPMVLFRMAKPETSWKSLNEPEFIKHFNKFVSIYKGIVYNEE